MNYPISVTVCGLVLKTVGKMACQATCQSEALLQFQNLIFLFSSARTNRPFSYNTNEVSAITDTVPFKPVLKGPMRWETTLCFKATWSEHFVSVYNKLYLCNLRPPAFRGHFHCAKGVASQDRCDCNVINLSECRKKIKLHRCKTAIIVFYFQKLSVEYEPMTQSTMPPSNMQ